MVVYFCPCLNVRIHSKGQAEPGQQQDHQGQLNLTLSRDSLDLAGITKEVPQLSIDRCSNSWTISRCLNCNTDTHACPLNDDSRVILSSRLLSNPNEFSDLLQSAAYSAVYHIIIQPTDEEFVEQNGNYPLFLPGLRSNETDSLQAVQLRVQSFLRRERNSTQERIQAYSNQQLSAFAQLEKQALRDQKHVVDLLSKIQVSNLGQDVPNNRNEEIVNPQPVSVPRTQNQSDNSDSQLVPDLLKGVSRLKGTNSVPVTRATGGPVQRSSALQMAGRRSLAAHIAKSVDADAIFMMEGDDIVPDDEETSSFYNSDEDLSDNEGIKPASKIVMQPNLAVFPNAQSKARTPVTAKVPNLPPPPPIMALPKDTKSSRATSSIPIYATSLPITISRSPWANKRQKSKDIVNQEILEAVGEQKGPVLPSDSSDDEAFSSKAPEEIAASIQALARSVRCNDGRDMFGDLPRPRLNTMD